MRFTRGGGWRREEEPSSADRFPLWHKLNSRGILKFGILKIESGGRKGKKMWYFRRDFRMLDISSLCI